MHKDIPPLISPPRQLPLIVLSQLCFAASLAYSLIQGAVVRSAGRNGGFRTAPYRTENQTIFGVTVGIVLVMWICAAVIAVRRRQTGTISFVIFAETMVCLVWPSFTH